MTVLISFELRWFIDGPLPARLDAWFQESLPACEVSIDKRDDIYLFQSGVDDFGIKLRDGKLEIKWRQMAKRFQGAHGVAGHGERWLKWAWKDPDGPQARHIAAWGTPHGPWITVAKERRQRKYRWKRGAFVPAPASDLVEFGIAVEVTSLQLQGRAYSTALIESFAPTPEAEQQVLEAAVEQICRDFPNSSSGLERSYGYPCWLGKCRYRTGQEE